MSQLPTPGGYTTERLSINKTADVCIAVLLVMSTVGWSALAGKDLNFDQLHYHFYIGSSLLNDRLSQDFMAANAQSYLNPLAYVPFYWMVEQGWHSLLIASVLATFHGFAIALAYAIARTVLGGEPRSRAIATLGSALAFLSPIFLMEAGTSFADISTAVFLLAALLCLLRSNLHQRWWLNGFLFAGALVGFAGGLKFSNLVFSPAFALVVLVMHPSPRAFLRGIALLCTGAIIGVIVAHGYWSWQLLNEFGNPESPTVASLMGSMAVPQGSDTFPRRFLPNDLLDAAALPFHMMAVRSWIYLESVAPDLRFAAVVLGAIATTFFWFKQGKGNNVASTLNEPRKQFALLVFFFAALMLWIFTSSNGRYGIFVSILCGPTLALQATNICRRKEAAITALVVLIGLQFAHVRNGQLRWVGEAWTSSWYEISVPKQLRESANLYLSLGGNSNSYIAPFLSQQSAFANPIGQLSIDSDGPGYSRLQALLEKYNGRVRVLAKASAPTNEDQDTIAYWGRRVDDALARFGFAVDMNDCMVISAAGARSPMDDNSDAGQHIRQYLRTCALLPRPYQHTAERDRIRNVVRKIIEWCPKLFGRPHGVVEQMPHGWSAVFSSTDNTLLVQNEHIILSPKQALSDLNLGTIGQWERGLRPDCEKMPANLRKAYSF